MFYIQITLLGVGGISENFLLEKIIKMAHSKFIELQDKNGICKIGFSFPKYNTEKPSFGNVLRLFANQREDLEMFEISKTLRKLSDYVHFTQIRFVPPEVLTYFQYQRFQVKGSVEALARRRAKRLGITFEEALRMYPDYKQEKLKLPFIKVKSSSTGKFFPMFIKRVEGEKSEKLEFNTYGLGISAFLPDF